MTGGAGNDTFFGDHDELVGNPGGNDMMTGHGGIDTFVFFAGNDNGIDVVTDFVVGTDVLRLADLVDEDDDGVAVGNSFDGDILIAFAGGGSVELNGVANPGINNLADLANFITVDFG